MDLSAAKPSGNATQGRDRSSRLYLHVSAFPCDSFAERVTGQVEATKHSAVKAGLPVLARAVAASNGPLEHGLRVG